MHPAIGQFLDSIAGGGFLGVDFFFVLSGFVISLNYSSDAAPITTRSYLQFLRKRIARIYPVHIAALTILIVVIGMLSVMSIPVARSGSRTLEGLLKSVLLVQGWAYPIRSTWNIPSWSVSSEWLAYLLFPAVSLLATRVPSRITRFSIYAGLLCIMPLIVSAFPMRGTMAYGIPRIAVEFSLGVMLHTSWRLAQCRILAPGWQYLAIICAIGVGNALALTQGGSATLMLAPLIAGGLVWVLANGEQRTSCFSSPAAQYLGRISYSLYMIHGVFILLVQSLLRHLEWTASTPHWTVGMTIATVGSLLAAHFLYTRIEEPARLRLSGRSLAQHPSISPESVKVVRIELEDASHCLALAKIGPTGFAGSPDRPCRMAGQGRTKRNCAGGASVPS